MMQMQQFLEKTERRKNLRVFKCLPTANADLKRPLPHSHAGEVSRRPKSLRPFGQGSRGRAFGISQARKGRDLRRALSNPSEAEDVAAAICGSGGS